MPVTNADDPFERFMAIRRALGVKDDAKADEVDSAIHAEMQYKAPVWFLVSRVRARLGLEK